MCRIKICLTALAMSLFLTGCGNSTENKTETSSTETSTVSEPVSENIPESSADTGSVTSDIVETSSETSSENSESTTSDIVDTSSETPTEPDTEVNEMTITVNGKEFSAKFSDTKAAEEFKAMLPLTLDMSELNGNEKYIYLDERFTAASEKVGHINSGDIMLYGSNCIVLFYESFGTPYSYTRIGYIEDPDGLEKAVGSGNVTVEFG